MQGHAQRIAGQWVCECRFMQRTEVTSRPVQEQSESSVGQGATECRFIQRAEVGSGRVSQDTCRKVVGIGHFHVGTFI